MGSCRKAISDFRFQDSDFGFLVAPPRRRDFETRNLKLEIILPSPAGCTDSVHQIFETGLGNSQ